MTALRNRALIVGAGLAGRAIVRSIAANSHMNVDVLGYVDDDPQLSGQHIESLSVLGALDDLPDLIDKLQISELIFALPSERGTLLRRVISSVQKRKLTYRILPSSIDVLQEDLSADFGQYLRRLTISDLLGGVLTRESQEKVAQSIRGKRIVITGAAGSIGSELARQVASYEPERLTLIDWWENGMFELREQLQGRGLTENTDFYIADIRDRERLSTIFNRAKPDAVFHAAAYKHVPLMEDNVAEAVKNNIQGTRTVAEEAVRSQAHSFLLVSTDKAVNPTNVMGATKRAAEQLIHLLGGAQEQTEFVAVRFGNVINSNGSVIPVFQRQIEAGGPVHVTHPDITRFFMTIPEAVHLMLQAWQLGKNGDLFVLDMGEAIRIQDLARMLIALNGYIPDEEIKVQFSGLRPGEKLYEEVLVDQEEATATAVAKVFKTRHHVDVDGISFLLNLSRILSDAHQEGISGASLKAQLQTLVSTYHPAEHSVSSS